MASNRGRTGKEWDTVREIVINRDNVCGICGKVVDKTLPYRDPATGRMNPLSKSVHHKVSLEEGGAMLDLSNLELAHFVCNAREGARTKNERRTNRTRPTSRLW